MKVTVQGRSTIEGLKLYVNATEARTLYFALWGQMQAYKKDFENANAQERWEDVQFLTEEMRKTSRILFELMDDYEDEDVREAVREWLDI